MGWGHDKRDKHHKGRGLKQKSPPWVGGGGEYGCFLDLHIIGSPFSVQRFPSYAGDIILYKWG